jgi:hypothetical protein
MPKKRTKYTAGEIGRVRVVDDSLPAPQALAKARRKRATPSTKHTAAEMRASAHPPRAAATRRDNLGKASFPAGRRGRKSPYRQA